MSFCVPVFVIAECLILVQTFLWITESYHNNSYKKPNISKHTKIAEVGWVSLLP